MQATASKLNKRSVKVDSRGICLRDCFYCRVCVGCQQHFQEYKVNALVQKHVTFFFYQNLRFCDTIYRFIRLGLDKIVS